MNLILSSGCKIIPFAETFSVPGSPVLLSLSPEGAAPSHWQQSPAARGNLQALQALCILSLLSEGIEVMYKLSMSWEKKWHNLLWKLSGGVAASLLAMEVEKWIDFWMHKSLIWRKAAGLITWNKMRTLGEEIMKCLLDQIWKMR